MAEAGTVTKLVSAFVMLIVGISLIGVVATQTTTNTQTTVTSPQTFTVAYLDGLNVNTTARFYPSIIATQAGTYMSDTDGCKTADIMGATTITNASGTGLTVTTDYVANAAGYITFTNTSAVRGSTNTTVGYFSYCPDGYTAQSWARTILNLVPGFFALALMAISLGMFYSLGRDAGIF
jgi:Tfp pilus assembly protein PilV